MKPDANRTLTAATLWIALLATVVPATAAPAESTPADGRTVPVLDQPHVLTEKSVRLTNSGSNIIRSGPGNSFAMVSIYPEGAAFVVIAKKDDWYNVRLSQTNTGWVHASLCEEFDDMSDLEFRPNPRLFSRIGSFSLSAYAGGYAFDRKSNSLALGGRLGYYVLEYVGVEGNIGWTRVRRPAEIVESLFDLTLEEEDFHMLYYAFNLNLKILPGRQMVPYATIGIGSSIMEGTTESGLNLGAGLNFFVRQRTAMSFEFRSYSMSSGSAEARRDNTNFEFSVGTSFLF
ncbi:MAG: outer membrane beta-barrel protein [bacterium]|nr:outer membrane beta-barrel protein [bacterium]